MYPYYFNFSTYVKGRWMGKTILDVCSKEFLSETPEYYVRFYVLSYFFGYKTVSP